MAKYDWGFAILNKSTAREDRAVVIQCTRTDAIAEFALGGNPAGEWGDCLLSDMPPNRQHEAEAALNTWGWI